MDLNLLFKVFWRFRALLALGFALAALLALTSLFRIELAGGLPSVSYRDDEIWLSTSTVLVTQDGFPWGRAVLDDVATGEAGDAAGQTSPRFGDDGRYVSLAAVYAELAKGDAIVREVAKDSTPGQTYESLAVQTPAGDGMPMIYFNGYGPTPGAAADVARRSSEAFRRYLSAQQARSDIPADKRVDVAVTQQATPPTLSEGRSVVRPLFLFLLVAIAFVALAFALENLRPRPRAVESEVRAVKPPVRAA